MPVLWAYMESTNGLCKLAKSLLLSSIMKFSCNGFAIQDKFKILPGTEYVKLSHRLTVLWNKFPLVHNEMSYIA